MKKLILCFTFLGLLTGPLVAQLNTTLGGTSCNLNYPSSITIPEGTMLYVTDYTSNNCGHSWSISPAKYAYFQTANYFAGSNSSTVKIEFAKAGIYYVNVTVNSYTGFGGDYVIVTVLPKIKKTNSINYLDQ